MEESIRILIADDHPIFRKGLVELIEATPGMEVMAEAENGDDLLRVMDLYHPHVVVLDVNMPKVDGLTAASKIRFSYPEVKLVMLTMRNDEDVFNEAMDIGVNGYILKENAIEDVINSIEAVAAGQTYLSPGISGHLVQRFNRPSKRMPEFVTLLTDSELRIFKLVGQSNTSKEISEKLFISIKTVENHRTNICKKLKLKGKNSLLKFALEHKLED
jgi:DNA-binding NarL/FixJ family response regulator